MRGRVLAPWAGLALLAGCTNYMPLPATESGWEEARLRAYGQQPPGAATPPSPTPTTPAAASADWGTPDHAARSSFDPKPLPPLATSSSAGPVRDTPVVTAPPASPPASSAPASRSPAEIEMAAVAETVPEPEPAPAPREVVTPEPEEPAANVATASAPLEPPAPPSRAEVAATMDDPLPPPALSGVGFLWPLPENDGEAVAARPDGDGGLVIEAPEGAPFVAAENGVVVFAADALETFGQMVVVRHDGDYTTAYAHADTLEVDVGDVVRRGQRLGRVGRSGAAATDQLYFEMRVGSRVVDPQAYLVGTPTFAAR